MVPLSDRLKMNQATSGGTSAIVTTVFGADFKRKNKKAEEGKSPEERKHPSKNCKRGMRQVTQRLIYLVGEPSGKCDYYVLYSKSKPSPPTTSFVMPKPSWSDTPESDQLTPDDDSWKAGIDPSFDGRKAYAGRIFAGLPWLC